MASMHPKKQKEKDDTDQILLVGFLHSSEFWNIVETFALPECNIWKATSVVKNPLYYPQGNPCMKILYTAFNSIGGVYTKMQRKANL